MKNRAFSLVIMLYVFAGFAQPELITNQFPKFEYQLKEVELLGKGNKHIIYCENCSYVTEENFAPRYFGKVFVNSIDNNYIYGLEVLSEVELPESFANTISAENLSENYVFSSTLGTSRKKHYLSYNIQLIRRSPTGKVFGLTNYQLKLKSVKPIQKRNATRSSASFKTNSVLSSGTWYKFGVTQEDIYKIDAAFLQSLGMDVSNIDFNSLRIFGNGGAMLSKQNASPRIDDLEEIAIEVNTSSESNSESTILFYGQSPHRWELNGDKFNHVWNLYSDTTYYFISSDYVQGSPKRIQSVSSTNPNASKVNSFNDYQFYERDLTNLIKSGRIWFGEQIGVNPQASFPFQFNNVLNGSEGRVKVSAAVRSIDNPSNLEVSVSNTSATFDTTLQRVVQDYSAPYATLGVLEFPFTVNSSSFNINVKLNKAVTTAIAWVDYIEVELRRRLQYSGSSLFFRDLNSVSSTVEFEISNPAQNLKVWQITDHQNVFQINGRYANGKYFFSANTNELQQFVAFKTADAILPQKIIGKVKNQNLHALPQADMLIITHPLFLPFAEDLAEFHRVKDTLTVNTALVHEIYNEFSSGKQDITAIKDFIRMFYERGGSDSTQIPKYVLLFGDASYNYKSKAASNTNFVPAYQSENSTRPTASYVSDDYFGLLDPSEGEGLADLLDVGIGRFPVRTIQEARNVVAKTKHYYNTASFGSWRNKLVYIADDEDGNIHMSQANSLATFVDTIEKNFDITKIFFDAFKQESTPGGKRYPEVNRAIDRTIQSGALIANYVGHGGELGWAHERVLDVPSINAWSNINSLPLFITATCEFTRFDDPARTSAGEYVFLNPDGGGIGLLTTTRLVYSSPNYDLAKSFNRIAFVKHQNRYPRLGDLNRLTKFNGPTSVNTRCFSLIGDPAVRLAYPKLNVVATQVPDSMNALQLVTVKGFVADYGMQKLNDFNGIVYPIVFAKEETIGTLNNDGDGVFNFKSQEKIIFRGKASVTNGNFEFSFVVPKDIDIEFGSGKVSFYAANTAFDASGAYKDHVIGGVDENAPEDNQGPDINLYLNDESFVYGGITNQNPILRAKLFDENGINTVGTGVGHDIVAVLDENTANAIVLNDFYQSILDSYQSGTIEYQLPELEEGPHKLSLKAWDVHNNSGEAEIEFIVANNSELQIDNILNYPNPFTTNTAFYFDHNQPGQNLQVRIQVFTVSGKVVKTIDGFYYSEGYRTGPIAWDGKDEFGDKIGRGVYVYKVHVKTPTGKTVEKFQRLVLLN